MLQFVFCTPIADSNQFFEYSLHNHVTGYSSNPFTFTDSVLQRNSISQFFIIFVAVCVRVSTCRRAVPYRGVPSAPQRTITSTYHYTGGMMKIIPLIPLRSLRKSIKQEMCKAEPKNKAINSLLAKLRRKMHVKIALNVPVATVQSKWHQTYSFSDSEKNIWATSRKHATCCTRTRNISCCGFIVFYSLKVDFRDHSTEVVCRVETDICINPLLFL